jgi:hypothetical protein
MSTFKIRDLINDPHHPLREYTRADGTSFLTSPSLRERQMNARTRQATTLGDSIDNPLAWLPYDGLAPASGYGVRWFDEHGWTVVTRHRVGLVTTQPVMAFLPDLPAGIDHPVFEHNPNDEREPFVVGGNRSCRDRFFYVDPMSLGIGAGIFFHTRHFGSYRDGGSWVISEATLVYDTRNYPTERHPHFMWGRDHEVTRVPVQVVSLVEWLPDPARPEPQPLGGKSVIISHREPLIRFVDGSLQRLRLVAYAGQIPGIGYRLVNVAPDKLGEEPNAKELEFLKMLAPK